MEQTNKEPQNKIKKFQCKAMQRMMYKKNKTVQNNYKKNLKILKFPNLIHFKIFLFMSQIETNIKPEESFT